MQLGKIAWSVTGVIIFGLAGTRLGYDEGVKQGREQGVEQGRQEGYLQGKNDAVMCLYDTKWDFLADDLDEHGAFRAPAHTTEDLYALDRTLGILGKIDCFNDISDSVRNKVFR